MLLLQLDFGLCRYEDNGDAVNNVVVITRSTDKGSVKDFGSPEDFLKDLSYLFGEQVFTGVPNKSQPL